MNIGRLLDRIPNGRRYRLSRSISIMCRKSSRSFSDLPHTRIFRHLVIEVCDARSFTIWHRIVINEFAVLSMSLPYLSDGQDELKRGTMVHLAGCPNESMVTFDNFTDYC